MPPTGYAGRFVRTLNGLGVMSTHMDACMEAFIAFAKTSAAPVADVGAAYGVATIPALKAGASVIAVDVDARHLEILKQRVPSALRNRLQTIAAPFPEGLSLAKDSIGAFLLSNVLNFLSPDRLPAAAGCLSQWLVAGGKIFIAAGTPYFGGARSFVPVYEARKRAGEPWPGHLTDVPKYAPIWEKKFSSMLLLDPDTLSRVFQKAGFVVEKAEFTARLDIPPSMQMDGRESVMLIARKP